MNDQKGKKRKKAYYINAAKKRKHVLEGGMTGFLITCNNREKEAVKEAYNLLNEYADELYGPEQVAEKKENCSSEDEEDIEDALKREVADLKAETSGEKPRRFQVVETHTNNCIFIKTTLGDPCELAYAIFNDIAETRKQKSRFILRMTPISATCRANEEAINKTAEQFLDKFFGYSEIGCSYSIQFKARNNNSMDRMTVINLFGRLISDMNPANHADLKNPDLCVIVDVVNKVCCLSVVKHFAKFRKYNLCEVAKQMERADQNAVTTDSAKEKVADQSHTHNAEERISHKDRDDKITQPDDVEDKQNSEKE